MSYEKFISFNLFPRYILKRPPEPWLPSTILFGPYTLGEAMRICWLLKKISIDVNWSYNITLSGVADRFYGTASFRRAEYSEYANYAALEPIKRVCASGSTYIGILNESPTLNINAPFFWEDYDESVPMHERMFGFECNFQGSMWGSREDMPFGLILHMCPLGNTDIDSYTLVHAQPASILGKDMILGLYMLQSVTDPASGYNFSSSADIYYKEEYYDR